VFFFLEVVRSHVHENMLTEDGLLTTGTTIPAYTAVMTGTPSGVGAFRAPKRFLNHGEVVEIEISNIGILKNKILFPAGKQPVL